MKIYSSINDDDMWQIRHSVTWNQK